MDSKNDFSKYYNLESYLFGEVGQKFRRHGTIDAADFYMILIWKANRAKNKHLQRLRKRNGTFRKAVDDIAKVLQTVLNPKGKLEALMSQKCGFRLPTASAVLTVLYPTEFSVYDYRACESLNIEYDLSERRFSDHLWGRYRSFLQKVETDVPGKNTLREKDRYLWGKSFYKEVKKVIEEK